MCKSYAAALLRSVTLKASAGGADGDAGLSELLVFKAEGGHLGSGGMSDVYRTLDDKVVKVPRHTSLSVVQQFEEEADALSKLSGASVHDQVRNHVPHGVRLRFQVTSHNVDWPVLVTDGPIGTPLSQWAEVYCPDAGSRGRLALADTVCQQLLPVLQFAHNTVRVAHLDVRPSNIVVTWADSDTPADSDLVSGAGAAGVNPCGAPAAGVPVPVAVLIDWGISMALGCHTRGRGTPEFSATGVFHVVTPTTGTKLAQARHDLESLVYTWIAIAYGDDASKAPWGSVVDNMEKVRADWISSRACKSNSTSFLPGMDSAASRLPQYLHGRQCDGWYSWTASDASGSFGDHGTAGASAVSVSAVRLCQRGAGVQVLAVEPGVLDD